VFGSAAKAIWDLTTPVVPRVSTMPDVHVVTLLWFGAAHPDCFSVAGTGYEISGWFEPVPALVPV
jgi:hypothetical protein